MVSATIKQFVYDWGWVMVNSLIWCYAGYKFSHGRAQRKRWLRHASPHERRLYEGMQMMERRVRRAAFRHPFWGKQKRSVFIQQIAQETVLMQLGYEKGDPCPIPCDRGYVDTYDPRDPFPERVPCPACRMIKEVFGEAPAQ